ncbi:MAG: hypothetical protein OXF97_03015 [Nitrospira sp.]|nr:hypothetical protein [Nitrospira sp.]
MQDQPFDRFVKAQYREYERHLKAEEYSGSLDNRLLGARLFANFLMGKPPKKGARTKDTF